MPEGKKGFPEKYCVRFGKLAIEMGFITQEQLCRAMEIQVEENLSSKPRKLIGQVLFEQDWMTPQQIDQVLKRLFDGLTEYLQPTSSQPVQAWRVAGKPCRSLRSREKFFRKPEKKV